jgi:hypothetical protein
MYGIKSLLAINPGTSLEVVVYFFINCAKVLVFVNVYSDVCNPLIISTNNITGTGFIKCIPITFSALFVKLAIFVIDIEDVFDANIALSFVRTLSKSLNTFYFASSFSIIAYIIPLPYLNNKITLSNFFYLL